MKKARSGRRRAERKLKSPSATLRTSRRDAGATGAAIRAAADGPAFAEAAAGGGFRRRAAGEASHFLFHSSFEEETRLGSMDRPHGLHVASKGGGLYSYRNPLAVPTRFELRS
jgi:hypothetical protein